jgi:uncharacterized protein YbaP (TraB family)
MFFWILALPVLAACTHSPVVASSPELAGLIESPSPIKRPLMWRIEKSTRSCFLLATMHIGIDAKTEMPNEVWRAFDAAQTFVSEHDVRHNPPPPPLPEEGSRLSNVLSDTAHANLLGTLAPLTSESLDHWSAGKAAFYYQATLLKQQLPARIPSLDATLFQEAVQRDKQLTFLEGMADAQAVIDQTVASVAELEAILVRDEVELAKELAAQFAELLQTYRSGDLRQIEDALMPQIGARGYEQLVARRNHQWLPSLEKSLDKGACFIAVGAGHTVGPDSLLTLLRDRGYKVERIEP